MDNKDNIIDVTSTSDITNQNNNSQNEELVRFCTKCGTKLNINNKFCTHCGNLNPFYKDDSSLEEARYCTNCGGQINIKSRICLHCGSVNPFYQESNSLTTVKESSKTHFDSKLIIASVFSIFIPLVTIIMASICLANLFSKDQKRDKTWRSNVIFAIVLLVIALTIQIYSVILSANELNDNGVTL